MSYHDEIRELLEADSNPILATQLPAGLREQAERLLAMPEAVVEALVQAATSGVAAVEAALCTGHVDPDDGHLKHDGDTCPVHEA